MRASLALLLLCAALPLHAQDRNVQHGVRPPRLAIRNAMVVDGSGSAAAGPYDIIVENGVITDLIGLDPVAVAENRVKRAPADAEIDATGKYVLPGLINLHGHLQASRAGIPQPREYTLKLWLAAGITTVRELATDTLDVIQRLRDRINRGEVPGPRLFLYPSITGRPTPRTAADVRARVRELKGKGVDGLKFFGMDRDLLDAAYDEARRQGLRTAHHIGVEETNALDAIRGGVTSIEHWYGVPDAALHDGVQHFPAEYNYNDEVDRFRYAGRLWREADPGRLDSVLTAMVKAGTAWDPTLAIYEASRDLQRAQTQPWFADYLHPALEEFFKPNPANHGSFFLNWTSTDEAYWKDNYRRWMAAVREFERKGGVVGTGEDAGFIYELYGFGLLRELELHEEAGFPTLKVIQHATVNGAKILGMEDRYGRVRVGYAADLIVVNGNPLANLRLLYPTGVQRVEHGKLVQAGGIAWTVANGIPYHVPQLMREVKELVAEARAQRAGK